MDVFDKIIDRQIPAVRLYEDEEIIAILDISQITPGHSLIIPKVCRRTIWDLDAELFSRLAAVAHKLSFCLREVFGCSGINLLANNGETAGQEVPHFHLHLIPRYSKEELRLVHSSGSINQEIRQKAGQVAALMEKAGS
jgi:histidine triad (HIT) family protein